MKRIDVAVVGCGHMGSHHAAAVARNPRCRLVALVDVVTDHAAHLAQEHGGEVLHGVPEGIDAVIVATPTSTHVEVAAPLVDAGMWCLVEKPLAPSAALAVRLRSGTLVVGHVERFNAAVLSLAPLHPSRMVARRVAPRGARGLDTDVVHDLMIHDLDLFLCWAKARIEVQSVEGGARGGADEAWAELVAGDFRALLHASRVARSRARTIDLHDTRGRTHLDLIKGTARGPSARPTQDSRDAIARQLDAFLDAIEGTAPRAVDFAAGSAALELADRICALASSTSEAVAGSV